MAKGQVSQMIGARAKRKEDPRLITGEGKYTVDVQLRSMAYVAVLRSPHAHALLNRMDISGATHLPDVLAVVTGRELNQASKAPFPLFVPLGGGAHRRGNGPGEA